jgi:hypothetical protein
MSRKVIYLLFLLIPTTVLAQQYEKNGLPCISGLCIGDGLPEIGRIKWDRAKETSASQVSPTMSGRIRYPQPRLH